MNKFAQLQTQAIQAAKAQDWEQAIAINLELLEHKDDDVFTLNRLGVAYLQLGNKKKAQQFFTKTTQLEKNNPIAVRYLKKIKSNQQVNLPTFCSQEFIEEPGKTKNTPLLRLANKDVLSELNVGQECQLKSKSRYVSVEVGGQYLGALPEDVSFRLTKLIKNGNTYSCRIRSLEDKTCTVFLKETHQSRKNCDTHSFVVNNSNNKSNTSYQLDDNLLRQEDVPLTIIDTDKDDSDSDSQNVPNLVEISEKADSLE